MLEGLQPPEKEAICSLIARSAMLSKEDHKALMDAISDPRWSNEALAAELSKRGFIISKEPIRRHRKKMCSCAK